MSVAIDALDAAIAQCNRLRALLKKKRDPQIRSFEERSLAKATALAWFNGQRPSVSDLGTAQLAVIDTRYKVLLAAADKAASRSKLATTLKALRASLIAIRSDAVVTPAGAPTTDSPPAFARLIADPQMCAILESRWDECVRCLAGNAPLAATVMMGGLLEALLLARINRESNKAPIFTSASAPRGSKAGQTRPLNEWTLKNYIDVVHERGWISVSAKDVGEVLRDYRNYIHPFKQLSHGVDLTGRDASLLWEVSKSITRQIIASAK